MEAGIARLVAFLGGLTILLIAEIRRPYRAPTVSKTGRWLINLGMTVLNNALLALAAVLIIAPVLNLTQEKNIGVLNLDILDLPYWAKVLIGVLFLDFMLYLWHLLTHMLPFLWRFHRAHHSDINMDVSTATRFHVGELFISLVVTAWHTLFLGLDVFTLVIFQSLVILATQFHHSSVRVPERFEKYFYALFTPPSMHRIHHSVKIRERNTNYGIILSIWDRIFGTLVTDVEQESIVIGIGDYNGRPEKLTFGSLLVMPFTKPVK